MEFESAYQAKVPDAQGFIQYSDEENAIWHDLYQRQMQLIKHRACDEFINGLSLLGLNDKAIPQLPDVSKALQQATGWQVAAVPALISAEAFFKLLANRRFPAATFIRNRDDFDYVTEPDIFHELFGHCPMLTNQIFADFVARYAEIVLALPKYEWPLLQRLFWFTVEFGLINTPQGLRIYGGGILSSCEEVIYSVESKLPERRRFDPIVAFRTPYRIDMLQTIYYVIDSYEQLYQLVQSGLTKELSLAHELGELMPTFPVDANNPAVHINAC